MSRNIKVGISRCLMGKKVRYDGSHKQYHYATQVLNEFFELQLFCPEVESGMTIPRPTIHLQGSPESPEVVEVLNPHISHTERLVGFSQSKVLELGHLSGFILKNKSPTCGMERVKVYQEKPQPPKMGVGVFANALMKQYPLLPVEEEGRLNDPQLRENFIERIFVYYRWQIQVKAKPSAKALLDFHTEHKLTLLAHHQEAYRELGKMLANIKDIDLSTFLETYIEKFMNAMKQIANRKNHTNVLMHIQGYFKQQLDPQDKAELTQAIERYRIGHFPLIVPITLLKHHLMKHPDPYLQQQRYLFPYPEEMMLRNHI